MAATSDERREVARKIREYVDAYGDKIEEAEMVLLGTVWCRGEVGEVVRPTSEAELLAMLAGLIDPTCENTKRRTEIYDRSFRCSACGYETWTYDDSDCDPWTFAYCPECGCRVVGGDGR